MSAFKRAAKELEQLRQQLPPYLRCLTCDDANVLAWRVLLLPDHPPYHLKAFNVCIDFPRDYPFMPPTLKFTTKIYHPNVGVEGEVCLPLISKENWSPYTHPSQVLEALNLLVTTPNLQEPLRVELADLLMKDPEQFWSKAEEFTLQYGVDRPS